MSELSIRGFPGPPISWVLLGELAVLSQLEKVKAVSMARPRMARLDLSFVFMVFGYGVWCFGLCRVWLFGGLVFGRRDSVCYGG